LRIPSWRPLRRAAFIAALALASAGVAAPAAAQTIDTLLFRIFLRDGSTLVSYGDFARVADRVVFSIPIAGLDTPTPALHLVSIAESAVDWERTDRYTAATRARRYAETRGEADFSELSDQVARALNDVALTRDATKRLALATDARRMLGAWPAAHYGYRAGDVKQLAALLDDAIAELRVGAGQSRVDLTLVAIADAAPPDEPAIPPPTPRESIDQVFAAATLTPNSSERVSLLEAILHTLQNGGGSAPWAATLHARATAELAAESRIDKAYTDLVARTIGAADGHAKRADVKGLDALLRGVLKADDKLGRKRPETTAALLATIDSKLDSARRLRLARDAWAIRQDGVRQFQRRVRSALDNFRRSTPALEQIRLLSGPSPAALQPLAIRLADVWADLKAIRPNAETQAVYDMLVNAVQMAGRAASSRRLAINAADMSTAWEASSAAAGAMLLFERAQDELKKLTTPPGL
jgi:hypothetical protein